MVRKCVNEKALSEMGGASLLFGKKQGDESDIGEEYLMVHLGRIPLEFYDGMDPAVSAMRKATHAVLQNKILTEWKKDKTRKKGRKNYYQRTRNISYPACDTVK